jgi:hypothetical protein
MNESACPARGSRIVCINDPLRSAQRAARILFPDAPFDSMKRSAAQYAVLSRLLDEALDLEETARALWLATLPSEHESQRQALSRMFTVDRATANRTLKRLQAHLRSSVHALRELSGR